METWMNEEEISVDYAKWDSRDASYSQNVQFHVHAVFGKNSQIYRLEPPPCRMASVPMAISGFATDSLLYKCIIKNLCKDTVKDNRSTTSVIGGFYDDDLVKITEIYCNNLSC